MSWTFDVDIYIFLLYMNLKNVSCDYDRLNGWNSTLQTEWYIRHVCWSCIFYISFMTRFLWTELTMWLIILRSTQFRIKKWRRSFAQNILIAGLLRPVIGEQWRSDHGGGGLLSSMLHKSWDLTSTYTELLAEIHTTYSTRAYNFNWPVPRTHASQLTFSLTWYVFLQLVLATYSKHACTQIWERFGNTER